MVTLSFSRVALCALVGAWLAGGAGCASNEPEQPTAATLPSSVPLPSVVPITTPAPPAPTATPPTPAPSTAPAQPKGKTSNKASSDPEQQALLDRTYYLDIDRVPWTLLLPSDTGAQDGLLTSEGGLSFSVYSASIPDEAGRFSVHVDLAGMAAWLQLRLVEGVVVGRWAPGADDEVLAASAYQGHVTGWNRAYFEQRTSARVFDLTRADGKQISLRIDLDTAAGHTPIGRWKIYSSVDFGSWDESDEIDLSVSLWDGEQLAFSVDDGSQTLDCQGTVDGRNISGSCGAGDDALSWTGHRAELLSYGLSARHDKAREDWQRRTRAALQALMMPDSTPLSLTATTVGEPQWPLSVNQSVPGRDDAYEEHSPDYVRQEIRLYETFASPTGGEPLTREIHGWLAIPTSDPPEGGFSAVVALNGHSGSAAQLLEPDNGIYWYGESFARRGMVVFALDVSHRPLEDRAALYSDYKNGDGPQYGNGTHPAIKAPGLDSDWEEDGERASDAMAGRRFLAEIGPVNADRIWIAGLSMGGEVTTYAAALDPAFSAAIPAGFSPDLGVLTTNGNHACWQWLHADVRDYLNVSDLHSLIAPRPLVLETGRLDSLFSRRAVPFAADKQVARRTRVAYGREVKRFAHYLHYDAHYFHTGDVANAEGEVGLVTPVLTVPTADTPLLWQSDELVTMTASSLYEFLQAQ